MQIVHIVQHIIEMDEVEEEDRIKDGQSDFCSSRFFDMR